MTNEKIQKLKTLAQVLEQNTTSARRFAGTRQHERAFALQGCIIADIAGVTNFNCRERRHLKRVYDARVTRLHTMSSAARTSGHKEITKQFGDNGKQPNNTRLFDQQARYDVGNRYNNFTKVYEPLISCNDEYDLKRVYAKDRRELDNMLSKRHQ